jgi:TRAP-type C4-dicarboxylate transport system permease small subunit
MRHLRVLASLLVLPLALLLFLQWPLRELVQAYSRQANDLAQILFALYVAVAIAAASHARVHLAAGVQAVQGGDRAVTTAPWRAWACLVCVGPWAAFMLWASFGTVRLSLLGLERFAETLTPGYFVIKLAQGLLLCLVLVQAGLDVRASMRNSRAAP